jgi:hypothetical protein
MGRSEKNIFGTKTSPVKSAGNKPQTSTIKKEEANISLPRILSWLCAENVTKKSITIQLGREKKDI